MADLEFGGTNSVRSLWENDDSSLTVVLDWGARRISAQANVFQDSCPPGELAKSRILGSLLDRQKRYWVSNERALARFSNGSWQVLQQAGASGDHLLYEDRAGSIWVNRERAGFWRYEGDRAESIKLRERAQDQSVACMMEDREGHLWVGTPHGLYQLRSKFIRAYSTADGLPSDECWSVCEGPDGAIWAETKGGAVRIHKDKIQAFSDQPQRSPRMSILMDSRETLWLGHGHDGIVAWRPGVQTNRYWSAAQPGIISGLTLESLFEDRAGRVWIGSAEHGVTWFEDGQPAARWGEFGLPTNSVRSIYQTRDGTMWFGTWRAGAVRWQGDIARIGRNFPVGKNHSPYVPEVSRFTVADGLADDRVFVFHEDADGTLWIGTHNGVSRFKNGRFFTFRTEHGLLDNVINWLEEDDFGRFWFSCNRGIFRIDRRELDAVADGGKARANSAVYGTVDGMLSPETNGEHQPAGCKDREGRLWFPTTQGLVVIDPRKLKDNDIPPPVVIEEVRADGQIVRGNGPPGEIPAFNTGTQKLKLPPGRARTLQFRYAANSFADPRRVRFRYRLSGRNDDWRETEERIAYYTDLRPGEYRFELKAANPHGVWTEVPAVFSFSLAPKFTQTPWFPLICALGLLAISGGIVRWRLRWQHRLLKLEQQQALAHERTRIARDLHDDLGTALTGLALELDVIRRDVQEIPASSNRLTATAQHTRQLAERMREVVWAVNPRCDTISSLASFLEQQTAQFLNCDGIRGRLEFPDEIPNLHLNSEARHQLILAVREALTNVVRHAGATQVVIKMAFEERMLMLQVIDNGCGFNARPEIGHGLHNMAQRLERIGALFSYKSGSGNGTTLTFRLPLANPSESKETLKP